MKKVDGLGFSQCMVIREATLLAFLCHPYLHPLILNSVAGTIVSNRQIITQSPNSQIVEAVFPQDERHGHGAQLRQYLRSLRGLFGIAKADKQQLATLLFGFLHKSAQAQDVLTRFVVQIRTAIFKANNA